MRHVALATQRWFRPAWRLLLVGVALLVSAPVLGWLSPDLPTPSQWVAAGYLAGSVMFACGWMLIASGLRPGGSIRRGAALGAASYAGIGIVSVVAYNIAIGAFPPDRVNDLLEDIAQLLLASLAWPFYLSYVFELFGLRFS